MTRQPSLPLRGLNWSPVVLTGLILVCAFLTWHARDRILQGNSDFVSYYTGVRIVQNGLGRSLYNLELQEHTQRVVLESIGSRLQFLDGLLAYNHPPFEILFFLPLSGLPYLQAFLVWGAISVACVALSVCILSGNASKGLPRRETSRFFLSAFAFFPVWVTLLQGQDSATTLMFLTLAFQGLRRSSDFRAGLWLSLLLQRFQILPLILLVLLLKKRWRVLAGFAAGAVVILLLCLFMVGISGLRDYGLLLVEMAGWIGRKGIYPSQMQCLRGQAYALWYPAHPMLANGATALATLALTVVLGFAWRGLWEPGGNRFDFQFALLVVVSLVVSPHLNFHDLTLLVLPSILILRNTMERSLSAPLKHLRVWTFVLCYPVVLTALIVSGWGPLRLAVWGMLIVILLLTQVLDLRSGPHLEIVDA